MEDRQPEGKQVTSKQAAQGLWDAMVYSEHYKTEYGTFLSEIKRFAQLEQIYICMMTDVPGAKIQEILEDREMGEGEKTKAVKGLWMQAFEKPQMPTEEQDRQIKEMNAYVQRLELQVTQMQADMSKIKTDKERSRKVGENDAAIFFEMPDEPEERAEKTQKEKPKPARRQRGRGNPFKELANDTASGSLRLDILESRVTELTEKLKSQEEEIARLKTEGTQVRGIILTPPETGGRFQKGRQKKMLEGEKEKIDRLLTEGYTADQLDFLLRCREEGVPWEMISYFDGKGIPVELMKKLKGYYMKERNVPESGTKEGGNDHG